MASRASTLSTQDAVTKAYLESIENITTKEFIADGAIVANTLVYITDEGKVKTATAHMTTNVYGIAETSVATGKPVNVGFGNLQVLAGSAIVAGNSLVVTDGGKAVKKITTATNLNTAITGSAFTNQPNNDGVTVVSDDAGDITQTATIWGTANGAPTVIVSETIALTGTVDADSIRTDWALIIGWLIDGAGAGSIELSKTSGGLEISTLTTGTLSDGVTVPTAPNCYGAIPTVVGSGASTKAVGIIGTNTDGDSVDVVVALDGTSAVDLGAANLASVEYIFTGDVEGTVTALAKTAGATSNESTPGYALESGALNTLVDVYITPVIK